MAQPDEVPRGTQAVLRSSTPGGALNRAMRPRSRDPGLLYWRQVVVTEAAAQRLLGFAPPVVSSLQGAGLVEHLSFHEGLQPTGAAGPSQVRGDVRFRASYLPVGLPWVRAVRASVRDGATLLTWSGERTDATGVEDEVWPARITSSTTDRGSDGAQVGQDFAVVEVGGVQFGVQVGESGLVCLTWRVRCAGSSFRASVMARKDPVPALELVLREGLLGVR